MLAKRPQRRVPTGHVCCNAPMGIWRDAELRGVAQYGSSTSAFRRQSNLLLCRLFLCPRWVRRIRAKLFVARATAPGTDGRLARREREENICFSRSYGAGSRRFELV